MDVADLYAIVDGGEGESLLLEGIRVGHWRFPALAYWPTLHHVSDLSLLIKPQHAAGLYSLTLLPLLAGWRSCDRSRRPALSRPESGSSDQGLAPNIPCDVRDDR